jgi:putative flippase GtrA
VARFARFIAVGGIGFIVDAAVLTLAMRYWGFPVYAARLLSFSLAVLTTWLLNRTFVFEARAGGAAAEYGRYFVTQLIGALCNLLVFVALIETLPPLATTPIVPLAFGAVLGAATNYVGAAWWVFQTGRRSNP